MTALEGGWRRPYENNNKKKRTLTAPDAEALLGGGRQRRVVGHRVFFPRIGPAGAPEAAQAWRCHSRCRRCLLLRLPIVAHPRGALLHRRTAPHPGPVRCHWGDARPGGEGTPRAWQHPPLLPTMGAIPRPRRCPPVVKTKKQTEQGQGIQQTANQRGRHNVASEPPCSSFFVFFFLFLSSSSWRTSGRCPAEYRCTVRTRMQKARGILVEGQGWREDTARPTRAAPRRPRNSAAPADPSRDHRPAVTAVSVGRVHQQLPSSDLPPAPRRTSLATSLSSPFNRSTPFRSCDAAASPLVPPLPLLLSSSPPLTPSLLCLVPRPRRARRHGPRRCPGCSAAWRRRPRSGCRRDRRAAGW